MTVCNENKYIYYNDSSVKEISAAEVVTSNAYTLVYKQRVTKENTYANLLARELGLGIERKIESNYIFEGEPVATKTGNGYLKERLVRGKDTMFLVKFSWGCAILKC